MVHQRYKIFYSKTYHKEGDILLIPLDVKSLYTNISNSKGIKAVKEAYHSFPKFDSNFE